MKKYYECFGTYVCVNEYRITIIYDNPGRETISKNDLVWLEAFKDTFKTNVKICTEEKFNTVLKRVLSILETL